ncbi:hypothetical protein ACFU78_37375, partial [Streptomyces tendae]
VHKAQVDAGHRPGATSEEAAEIKRLKAENAELRRVSDRRPGPLRGGEDTRRPRLRHQGRPRQIHDPAGALASPLRIAWVTADSAHGQEWRMRRMLEEADVGYVRASRSPSPSPRWARSIS